MFPLCILSLCLFYVCKFGPGYLYNTLIDIILIISLVLMYAIFGYIYIFTQIVHLIFLFIKTQTRQGKTYYDYDYGFLNI